ncbi:retrotransposon protein [Tanacetum coccineum]
MPLSKKHGVIVKIGTNFKMTQLVLWRSTLKKEQTKPFISNNDLDVIDLKKENEELLRFNKDFTKTFQKLLNEKRSLKSENSKPLSKINDLEFKVCLKCDLLPDDWIVDSGCTKHMTGNRRLFTSYKAYDGGHVVFESNLKGKVIGGGNITHDSIIITNVEYVSGLAFNLISVGDNSKQQSCLASVVDNSMLWHTRLGHVNMRESRSSAKHHLFALSCNLLPPCDLVPSDRHAHTFLYLESWGIAMLAISLFPITFAESMAVIILKEAQVPWMAEMKVLKALTEETQERRAET